MDILSTFAEYAKTGKAAALCTIIETSGSTPRKPGTKMIVTGEGKNIGSVGGGILEDGVIKDAVKCIETGTTSLRSYSSGDRNDGPAYGEAKVFIEPLPKLRHLYIFGAGHVGQAVATQARNFGFKVHLIDPREGLMDKINIEGVSLIRNEYLDAAADLSFDKNTFVIVMTHSHGLDEEVSFYCAKKPHAYLGMIGSKKKVDTARKTFQSRGLTESEIAGIDMPIGIAIKCETPEEIAISIIARVIHIKNT